MKTKIKRWKLPIIRWALRELTPMLPALDDATFETLARFGIDDLYYEPNTKTYALYPSGEKYTPEPL